MKACSMCLNMAEGDCRLGRPEKKHSGKPRRASHCRDFKERGPADLRTLLTPPPKKTKGKKWAAEVTDRGEAVTVTIIGGGKPTPMSFKDTLCSSRNDFEGYAKMRVKGIKEVLENAS